MKPVPVTYDDIKNTAPWDSMIAFSPDVVIGIERGGCMLAAMTAYRLRAELVTVRASLYDDSRPARELRAKPIVEPPPGLSATIADKRVLVVDDVSNTGRTLGAVAECARTAGAREIKTFVYAGKADFSCRPFGKCLKFPWEDSQ